MFRNNSALIAAAQTRFVTAVATESSSLCAQVLRDLHAARHLEDRERDDRRQSHVNSAERVSSEVRELPRIFVLNSADKSELMNSNSH